MKSMKRGLAVLLAVLLVRPTLPVSAEAVETQPVDTEVMETQQDVLSGYEVPLTDTDADVSGNEVTGSAEGNDSTPGTEEDGDVSGNEAAGVIPGGEVPEFGTPAVVFSTGGEYQLVVNPSVSEEEGYEGYAGIFGEDGSYTIQIPEEDPFFPYEVQFVDPETSEPQNVWFMTPDSTVEFGGHTFRVAANFTGNAVTQLSLNIAGDVVVIYPEEKE